MSDSSAEILEDSLMIDSDSEPSRSPLKQLNVIKTKPNDKTSKNESKDKRLSVERIFQKKTPHEHILIRPDTYIGSIALETKQMWVFDGEKGMQLRDISYVPGLYKIFDEILVNAADNKQRDPKMSCIRVDIDAEKNEISIFNNGKGIPVVEHKDEKMFVPSLIFGHLLTSSNYNDDEKKVVGGRNGYGAKLCNIFSSRFKVETSCKENKKAFSQVWTNNMMTAGEPKITAATGEDFTRITFQPDLSKFKMAKLDADIVALFSRRAYDVAGSSKGVKVFLNGERIHVNGFKDYIEQFIKDKEDETGNPLKIAYEAVNNRWEIGITVSDKGFQQNSFVNSIATTRGGKHVDYIADQIVGKMTEIIKKKNKAGVNVKPFQIKNHLWVFVNCLIENPTFDSQTKETMTLLSKSFGSKCNPTEKFFAAAMKTGIVESVMNWVKFKAQTELSKQCNAKKQSKLKGVPKLEDANDAGTKNSVDCTLILTEGDSAKSLVVAGLGVIGRDKYGVFPLRGKMLNVREATHKQILENAEINNLIKILGLQYKKQYNTKEDLKTLRYGKIMIMTDQDQDGSHIKGLLINFIHHNWPKLLELNFLEEFITPIVKVSKGNQGKAFYSLPEFEEWKSSTNNWSTWRVKYYKGLGTSTSAEAKEYFSDMIRHRITFKYCGAEDDRAVELAFSKKMIEQRKDWLTANLEERKRRREMGLSEVYLYESNTRSVSYKDFVDKELILFSNMDNERSIPSIMDGLKPGQRKVLFTCFKRNDKREVKVAQLAGSVGEQSAYHHGEASLMSTIIGLAQNFVGSNNINLLQPIGQFGTRLQGGKDAASPRYIFTMLSPLARKIFPSLDDPLLNSLYDDNLKIEPEYYAPILPMVLVNGAEGIGTGWSTKIPNYNPREIVENLRRMIRGEEPQQMQPWFKGFRGTITQVDAQKYVINGEVGLLDEKSFEVTELPIRTWTQSYKESTLELLLHGNEKTPPFINEYREYHTESTVRFVITLNENNLQKSLKDGIHKTFKLQTSMSTTSMVLFDQNGCLKRYETPEQILREYFPVRLQFYVKRKIYYEGKLEAEALKLENQAKFILEKNDGLIRMENVKKNDFVKQLIDRKYDSDPVKAWIKKNGLAAEDKEETNKTNDEDAIEDDVEEQTELQTDKKYDFDYLFDMSMRSMLKEKVEQLLKQRDSKKEELEQLKKMTPEMLWEEDLNAFIQELDSYEELEAQIGSATGKPLKLSSKSTTTKGKKAVKNTFRLSIEAKPCNYAERVEPKIDIESYKKTEKVAKKPKVEKKTKNKDNEDDNDVIIDEESPESNKPAKNEKGEPNVKKSRKVLPKSSSLITSYFGKDSEKPKETQNQKNQKKKTTKKSNPWSDTESESEEDYKFIASSDETEVEEKEDFKPKKQTIGKKLSSKPTSKPNPRPKSDSESEQPVKKVKKITIDSDSDVDIVAKKSSKPKQTSKPIPRQKKKEMDSESEQPISKRVKKTVIDSDSDSDVGIVTKKSSKPKKSAFSDSEDEIAVIGLNERLESRAQPVRQRKATKYVFDNSDDDE